ncbi:hypothetical protein, partial [Alteripontixanthobacter muriae]|uniref:hypothetical protein n=1 Tax=Alteripontixanthobacter muriae TaxID=2705546 RepID=UPI001E391F48
MDNPGKHTPVIHPRHPARILRQERLNPSPLLIREPEEICHPHASSLEAHESHPNAAVNPVYGSGP